MPMLCRAALRRVRRLPARGLGRLIATSVAVLALQAHAQPAAARAAAPIKVGAVSSLALFPEATAAVRAYFDAVNADGGVRGRKLQLVVEDDQADPQQAQRAARKLVDQEAVVAHVGSASALECAVNASFYTQRNVVSVQGTGVDPVCFNSPNISPLTPVPTWGQRSP